MGLILQRFYTRWIPIRTKVPEVKTVWKPIWATVEPPFSLRMCLRRISHTVTIKCYKMPYVKAKIEWDTMRFPIPGIPVPISVSLRFGLRSPEECGMGFHFIDVWLNHNFVFGGDGDEVVKGCSVCLKPRDVAIAKTGLHEMVHVCCRGEDAAYGCAKSCFEEFGYCGKGEANKCSGSGL